MVCTFWTVHKRWHEKDLVAGSRIQDASLAPTIEETQATLEVVFIKCLMVFNAVKEVPMVLVHAGFLFVISV